MRTRLNMALAAVCLYAAFAVWLNATASKHEAWSSLAAQARQGQDAPVATVGHDRPAPKPWGTR